MARIVFDSISWRGDVYIKTQKQRLRKLAHTEPQTDGSWHIFARAFVNWHCSNIYVNNPKLIYISFEPNVNKLLSLHKYLNNNESEEKNRVIKMCKNYEWNVTHWIRSGGEWNPIIGSRLSWYCWSCYHSPQYTEFQRTKRKPKIKKANGNDNWMKKKHTLRTKLPALTDSCLSRAWILDKHDSLCSLFSSCIALPFLSILLLQITTNEYI